MALERIVSTAIPELAGRIAVLGFPHAVHGEELGAYVEADGGRTMSRARLIAAVEALAGEQRPKIILHGARPDPAHAHRQGPASQAGAAVRAVARTCIAAARSAS